MANGCPENTELQLKCKATPKKGESIVAAEIFDAINVCRGNAQAALVITKGKETQTAPVDQIEDRMGGTTYRIVTEDVDYTFSAPVVFAKKFPATLGVELKKAGMKATATYTCTR
jgi:hypothetical protein